MQCPPSQNLGPCHRQNSDFKILPALGVLGILVLLTKESHVFEASLGYILIHISKREGRRRKEEKQNKNLPKLPQLKSRLSKPQ